MRLLRHRFGGVGPAGQGGRPPPVRRLAAAGHKPKSVEGTNGGRWALLDYFDVVVHVFNTRSREYFQLERLWSEGSRLDLKPAWFGDPTVAARHPDLNFATAAGFGGAD